MTIIDILSHKMKNIPKTYYIFMAGSGIFILYIASKDVQNLNSMYYQYVRMFSTFESISYPP